MKYTGLVLLFCGIAISGFSQNVKGSLVASISGADRISLVKSSIDVPVWHEKSFWPLYENYLAKVEEASAHTYQSVNNLARTDKSVSEAEALDHANKLISYRYDMLTVKKHYFGEVGSALNGIIALQFLQTEVLLDMVESSRVYEDTYWKNYRFRPQALSYGQRKAAKQNTITVALSLTAEEAGNFWKVYNRYEEECDDLLGEDFSVFALYTGEPTDFTPALAKRLGYDFLRIMERELVIKEKYFREMNTAVGPSLAARFLAWEDYNSIVNKMYAWAENQN